MPVQNVTLLKVYLRLGIEYMLIIDYVIGVWVALENRSARICKVLYWFWAMLKWSVLYRLTSWTLKNPLSLFENALTNTFHPPSVIQQTFISTRGLFFSFHELDAQLNRTHVSPRLIQSLKKKKKKRETLTDSSTIQLPSFSVKISIWHEEPVRRVWVPIWQIWRPKARDEAGFRCAAAWQNHKDSSKCLFVFFFFFANTKTTKNVGRVTCFPFSPLFPKINT